MLAVWLAEISCYFPVCSRSAHPAFWQTPRITRHFDCCTHWREGEQKMSNGLGLIVHLWDSAAGRVEFSAPERYSPDLVIVVGGGGRWLSDWAWLAMLILIHSSFFENGRSFGQWLAAGWTISQHHPTKHEGEEEAAFHSKELLQPSPSDLWLYEGRLNRRNLRSLDREKSFGADSGAGLGWAAELGCGHFQSGTAAERSRATITVQRLHLILFLAARRTAVINSPLPSIPEYYETCTS